MAITFISKSDILSVYVWEISEDISFLLNRAELTSDEIEQYDRFRAESRKRQWLAVRVLANHILGQKVLISYNEFGRPLLANQGAFLSISHSDKFAAIAVGNNNLLGVDIESLTRNYSKVKHKFVSEKDAEVFVAKGLDESQYLPIIWCAKEAAYKAANCFEVDFIRDVSIKRVVVNDDFSDGEVSVIFNPLDTTASFKFSVFNNHAVVWGDYGSI